MANESQLHKIQCDKHGKQTRVLLESAPDDDNPMKLTVCFKCVMEAIAENSAYAVWEEL